ncbi:MAG TPA: MBL fold metallo-hydrolase [Bacillales bacterium]|nr:MBL fold metallo-hydrolase [Bacillales bacterium]
MKPVYKKGQALVEEIRNTSVPKGAVAIWHLGQSGILIKGEDASLVIDPYLTFSIEERDPDNEFKRDFVPPLDPEDLAGVGGVLITHFHDDHLDTATLEPLAAVSEETLFAIPASHLSLSRKIDSEKVIGVRDDQSFSLAGFQVTPVTVAHTEYETDDDGNSFYFGYLIEGNGVKLFHSGDTIVDQKIVDEVKRFAPDIVFMPINGGDYARTSRGIIGNMNYRDAADFGVSVGADMIMPVHYDLFPNNRENPAYFVDYLFHSYPDQKFHMMVPGERFIYFS